MIDLSVCCSEHDVSRCFSEHGGTLLMSWRSWPEPPLLGVSKKKVFYVWNLALAAIKLMSSDDGCRGPPSLGRINHSAWKPEAGGRDPDPGGGTQNLEAGNRNLELGTWKPKAGAYDRLIPAVTINQMKIYGHCSTSTTLLTGSGHDQQLISRIPPCSLKHIDTLCSLQRIDRFSLLEVFLFPGEGVVPGTGPGILHSGEPGCLLAGTQRPVSFLGSGEIQYLSIFPQQFAPYCSISLSNSGNNLCTHVNGVAHSQQASLRQDIDPVILRSRVPLRPEPYSEPGGGPLSLFETGVWRYRTADFLSKMEKLWASDAILETAEPGALMFPEEELKGLMHGNRSGGWCLFG
ncbi:hypothetical protein DY000_02040742 [Brassica cretica]|uniref:Uncharacterized protein n=1 Tax=Brassica cretica TaxID=69181 RepID=A0ABQ7BG56_BRACR|nr:hypothetical protein DY000_02040742 [Brassica cretica]